MSHRSDRGNDRGIIAVEHDFLDKGPVDLKPVDRQIFQIIERTISRAEIIDTDMYPQALQALKLA
ncbi:hypothetical protein D3C81_2321770 [compost metagenome]